MQDGGISRKCNIHRHLEQLFRRRGTRRAETHHLHTHISYIQTKEHRGEGRYGKSGPDETQKGGEEIDKGWKQATEASRGRDPHHDSFTYRAGEGRAADASVCGVKKWEILLAGWLDDPPRRRFHCKWGASWPNTLPYPLSQLAIRGSHHPPRRLLLDEDRQKSGPARGGTKSRALCLDLIFMQAHTAL